MYTSFFFGQGNVLFYTVFSNIFSVNGESETFFEQRFEILFDKNDKICYNIKIQTIFCLYFFVLIFFYLLYQAPLCGVRLEHGASLTSKSIQSVGADVSMPAEQTPSSAVKHGWPRKTPTKTRRRIKNTVPYRPEFCARLLAFFDVPPFKITEVQKKDGSVSLVETASELPTFAAFARILGVTQSTLLAWEEEHAEFAEAAKKARDLQGDILIQNSLRGNYSSSFAVFTAKNILGWSDGKDEVKTPQAPLVVRWEKE